MEEILVTINKEGFIVMNDNDFKNCLKWLKEKYKSILSNNSRNIL